MTGKYPEQNSSSSTLERWRFLTRRILELGIFSAAINILLLISPVYMLQMYDRVIPAQSFSTLIHLSIIGFAGLAVLGVLEVIRSAYANRVASQIEVRIGHEAFLASLAGPRAAFGDIQPIRDMTTIRSFIASRTIFFLFDLPFAPLFLGLLYLIHPVLFWLTFGGVVVLILLAILNQLATGRTAAASGERLASSMALAQSFTRSSEAIRALGMVGNVADTWGQRYADSLLATEKVSGTNGALAGVSRSFRTGLQLAILGVGAYLVLQHEITAGMIFASSLISGRALQPLDQIIGGWRQIIDSKRAWKRLNALSNGGFGQIQKGFSLTDNEGALSVEGLVYSVPGAEPGNPLIKRITFKVEAGQSLAIIGPSRAGKSTLARLLVGAIAPQSGQVRLDGADIRNFGADALGRRVGYMPQDIELFPGTLAQNIARFDSGDRDEAVVEAAKAAQAHGVVLAIKKGYLAEVGPAGIRLSGGEKQRIALARAFYGHPRLFVLDEPNAHLDSEGELALERAIEEARARKATMILITHKPSVAARCDQIMVLRDGMVEAIGPSQEMLRKLMQSVPSGPPRGDAGAAPNPASTPIVVPRPHLRESAN